MDGYYLWEGKTTGPLPMTEIVRLAHEGAIPPDTLVWNERMSGWRPLREAFPAEFASRRSAGYASFWERVAATLIDGVVCNVIVTVLVAGLSAILFWADGHPVLTAVLPAFLTMVVVALYYGLMESSRFQATLGKLALGLRVTTLDGARVSFGRALARYLGKTISGFLLMLGYLMMLWSPTSQCLHDRIAGTLVVRKGECDGARP